MAHPRFQNRSWSHPSSCPWAEILLGHLFQGAHVGFPSWPWACREIYRFVVHVSNQFPHIATEFSVALGSLAYEREGSFAVRSMTYQNHGCLGHVGQLPME